MAAEVEFCENYLLIKPEEASWFDLLRILCSETLENRDFYRTPVEAEVVRFRRRWIVFISVLLQKLLLLLKKPLAAVGAAVELLLNYPASNGGFLGLLWNLLTGRLVRPDKSAAYFTSVIGSSDKRLYLDTSIRNHEKYKAALAMMAAKSSYENEAFVRNIVTNHWHMEFVGFYDFWNDFQDLKTTNAMMFQDKNVDPNLIVVAFRGTAPFEADAWRTDMDISWYEFPGVGKIHSGFMKALGLQKSTGWPKEISRPGKSFAYYAIRDKLKTLIHENGDAKFIVTGHSLGGALAILFASVLTIHEEELLLQRLDGVYTFGQPRVGDAQFGEYMKGKMTRYDVEYFRFVYSNDVVPRLPYDDKTFLFKHFGPCLYFNSCYKGQVLEEEPNKNYFSVLYVVPKILNAVYELIRGFILPWIKGPDYREAWVMKLFRVIALLLPGLVNHFPVDYVNLTRLGKLPSFIHLQGPNLNLKHD
ncbi:Lipase [Sesamum alatum]|uniref:Lipase n=1 Tax=Sesamum alatum TaxID=300844 RepID=A0AAE1YQT1_9LAMI|nr:Lipase [Sesamum alatum]